MGLSNETRNRLDNMIEREKQNRRCSRCGVRVTYPACYCSSCRQKIYQESQRALNKKNGG